MNVVSCGVYHLLRFQYTIKMRDALLPPTDLKLVVQLAAEGPEKRKCVCRLHALHVDLFHARHSASPHLNRFLDAADRFDLKEKGVRVCTQKNRPLLIFVSRSSQKNNVWICASITRRNHVVSRWSISLMCARATAGVRSRRSEHVFYLSICDCGRPRVIVGTNRIE